MGGPTNSEGMEFMYACSQMLNTWLACLKTYIEIGVCENLGGIVVIQAYLGALFASVFLGTSAIQRRM